MGHLSEHQFSVTSTCLEPWNLRKTPRPGRLRETRWRGTPAKRVQQGATLRSRDLLQANKAAHRIARLCAYSEPMLDALGVQLDLRRLLQRIVCSHRFDDPSIPRAGALDHHHSIKRFLLLSNPR